MSRRTDEAALAARYRALLDAYPRWYREHRGDELLATVLDTARPGQRWPSWREARALVLEGLRVRAGTSTHRPARATVAGGIQFAVLLMLAASVLEGPAWLTQVDGHARTPGWWFVAGLLTAAGVVPFVLVATGRVRLALPAVPIAGAVAVVGYSWLRVPAVGSWYLVGGSHLASLVVTTVGTAVLWRLRPPAAGRGALIGVLASAALWAVASWAAVTTVDAVDVLSRSGWRSSPWPMSGRSSTP